MNWSAWCSSRNIVVDFRKSPSSSFQIMTFCAPCLLFHLVPLLSSLNSNESYWTVRLYYLVVPFFTWWISPSLALHGHLVIICRQDLSTSILPKVACWLLTDNRYFGSTFFSFPEPMMAPDFIWLLLQWRCTSPRYSTARASLHFMPFINRL